MLKSIRAVFIVIGLSVLVGCGNSKESRIEQMVREIYTPQDIASFKRAKEKNVKDKVITQEVSERLFQLRDNELTDIDKSRRVSILESGVSAGTDNSTGGARARLKARVTSTLGSSILTYDFYYNADGVIYDYRLVEE